MTSYLLGFRDIDQTMLKEVGGKGASLGELSRIEGISVPDGFCISTEAYKRTVREAASIDELLDQLSLLTVEDRGAIRELSAEIRRGIEGLAIPQEIREEITDFLLKTYDLYPFDKNLYPTFIALMEQDKKNEDGLINFSLLPAIGEVAVNRTCNRQLIEESLDYFNGKIQGVCN